MTSSLVAGACLSVSGAFHVWLALSLSQPAKSVPRRRPPAQVVLSVPAPPPPLAEPVTPPLPKAPAPVKHKAPPAPAVAPSSAPEPAAEPTPEPPALAGTTLVSDQGAAWTAPRGDGTSRDAPMTAAGFARTEPTPAVRAAPTPAAAPEVPLARLGKPPVPPPLESALRRNYPPTARRQGQSGEAKVRARIEPNGRIQVANLGFESAPGFGEACRRTLLDSRWSAPFDHDGRAVATWITYRCKFRVDD